MPAAHHGPNRSALTGAGRLCFLPPARRCVIAAGLFVALAGCDHAPTPEPLYYAPDNYSPAALQSSSNDATRCIELIEDGRVTLNGTKEDREQVMNRLYAICARGER